MRHLTDNWSVTKTKCTNPDQHVFWQNLNWDGTFSLLNSKFQSNECSKRWRACSDCADTPIYKYSRLAVYVGDKVYLLRFVPTDNGSYQLTILMLPTYLFTKRPQSLEQLYMAFMEEIKTAYCINLVHSLRRSRPGRIRMSSEQYRLLSDTFNIFSYTRLFSYPVAFLTFVGFLLVREIIFSAGPIHTYTQIYIYIWMCVC